MAYSVIKKPSDYFNTKLYTGNNTTNTSITGVGFQPDLVWIKSRSAANSSALFNSIVGSVYHLVSNSTAAEAGDGSYFKSFDSDGFTLGTGGQVNDNAVTYASWNWLGANGTASNTDGSITSTVSANTTSGFSIVKYTGTGANATVGHGLGVAPKMIIGKGLDNTINWTVGGSNISSNWTSSLALNSTAALNTANYWQDQAPNTSTFALSSDIGVNANGLDFIAYCFAEKQGFSKFGSYTGNGNADGTFVYTGFKPAWLIVKQTNASGEGWYMWDNKRSSSGGANENDRYLIASASNAEGTLGVDCDFLSNGFKHRYTGNASNGSGNTYIYMAFAEEPLVGDNPTTAR